MAVEIDIDNPLVIKKPSTSPALSNRQGEWFICWMADQPVKDGF